MLLLIALPACSDERGSTPEIDGSIVADAAADAAVPCTVVRYDWNDGTTQGWTASTSVSNTGSTLVVRNQGNGSLQAFGPQAASSLTEMDVISFTVHIDQYSVVTRDPRRG